MRDQFQVSLLGLLMAILMFNAVLCIFVLLPFVWYEIRKLLNFLSLLRQIQGSIRPSQVCLSVLPQYFIYCVKFTTAFLFPLALSLYFPFFSFSVLS